MARICSHRNKVKIIKFYDHFTSEERQKQCVLEVVGWIVKKNKKYLVVSNCLQDGKGFHGCYFSILRSAIISIK